MSMMLAGLALLAGAGDQDASQMRVRASSEAEAVADFEATCIAGLYDTPALARGAAASKRGYVTAAATTSLSGHLSWASPYGSLDHFAAVPRRKGAYPQCSMTAFTRRAVDGGAMRASIDAMLARVSRQRPGLQTSSNMLVWHCRDSRKRWIALYWVIDPRTPQQITLSVRAEEPPVPEGYVRR